MMRYFNALLLFTLAGCAAKEPVYSRGMEKRCSAVLEEILTIQDLRSVNNRTLQHKRAEGRVTDEDIELWRQFEHDLASRVNKLYTIADRRRCFRGVEKFFLTLS